MGASWEGFVLDQLIRHLGVDHEECFFWTTHSGAGLDLLVVCGTRRMGFEIKHTSSPKLTPSMRHALADLRLDSLTVIHAGDHGSAGGQDHRRSTSRPAALHPASSLTKQRHRRFKSNIEILTVSPVLAGGLPVGLLPPPPIPTSRPARPTRRCPGPAACSRTRRVSPAPRSVKCSRLHQR